MKSAVPHRRGRWGQDRRLEFIDSRLQWSGRLNRSSLTEFFGISVPQASLDLSEYQAQAPGNMLYDRSDKLYRAAPGFQPLLTDATSDRYLAELYALVNGMISADASFLADVPETAIVRHPTRSVQAELLRAVLEAIRTGGAIEINYQSMSRAEPTLRQISPRGLAYDGARWHVRAFCHRREAFCDFVFARVLDYVAPLPAQHVPEVDDEWERLLTIMVGPHPDLSPGQRRAIELDYEMVDGQLAITTRQCLAYYLLRRLGVHRSTGELPGNEQQIVLLNREELAQHVPSLLK
ncbi:WYL domain-containing protein [Stenotrophomonas sp. HMSC10F07]|nr:WYL domain-containing protein [Stenotrophomonas sp. HMSC10F07]